MSNSKLLVECLNQAKQQGEDLFPINCLEIIEAVYGTKHMENMPPKTLFNYISKMMMTLVNGDPDLDDEIKEVVNDWLNDF